MDIASILIHKYPDSSWRLTGSGYKDLEWLDQSAKPTKKQLVELWPEVEKLLLKRQMSEMRAQAYRDESDPLFFKYQAGEATEQEWQQARQDVRDRYPYPEEIN